jgi:hypothetical protein
MDDTERGDLEANNANDPSDAEDKAADAAYWTPHRLARKLTDLDYRLDDLHEALLQEIAGLRHRIEKLEARDV